MRSFITVAAAIAVATLAACSNDSTAPSNVTATGRTALAASENGQEHRVIPMSAAGRSCRAEPYTLGSSENGAWTAGDCIAPDGRRYDMYDFTITTQTAFRAQITGHTGRRVSLRRTGTTQYVQLMASEGWMPSASNPLEVRYVLAPGSYTFEVATRDGATVGSYTLATSTDAAVTCRPVVFVTPGVTISERIDPAVDCAGPFGGVEDLFIILPPNGTRLDLSVATTAFAPLVVYRDDRLGPASPMLTRDFRTTIGATARTSYTTTFEGFQEIVVGHINPGGSGAYTLTIAQGDAADTCTPIATTAAGTRTAFWETTDCLDDGYRTDGYSLSLPSQTALKVQLISPLGSKTAGVFSAGKEVLNYVTGTNDLNATWFLAPGSYELRTGIPAASAPASYSMVTSATNGNITCTNNATSGNVSFASQTLATGDCTFNSRFEDRLFVLAEAGKTITMTMNGSVAPSAVIRDPGTTPGTFLVRSALSTAGSVTATWNVTRTGYYMIIFTTNLQNQTGAYTGSVTVQ